MCGIAGLWDYCGSKKEYNYEIKKMTDAIYNRGPDSYGHWNDEDELFFLGHRRLSILDLSKAGHQPMLSKDNRYVISFNGEIYNHLDLKFELDKIHNNQQWRGHSDTEVLLELIRFYGLEKAIMKCKGMFSFALWDRKEKSLKLVRDRMGEKPLYYGFSGKNNQTFIFASEISALKAFKYFNNKINPLGLSQLINFKSISAPCSIYEGIYQLLPGHILTLNYPKKELLNESKPWWDLMSEIDKSMQDPIDSKSEAKLILENVLRESVKRQSIADVPLGTFLSGGIDSSLITALLQDESNQKIKSFTIGFEEEGFNEAPFAKKIADYLGTDHNEIYLTAQDSLNLIPELNRIYSEPFADDSQIPTYLVCKEAINNGLKVALSGDGGDELFGGYNRYLLGEYIWKKLDHIPWQMRKIIGNIGLKMPYRSLNQLSHFFGVNQIGSKINKLSKRLTQVKNADEFYYSLISQWIDPTYIFHEDYRKQEIHTLPKSIDNKLIREFGNNLTEKMMIYDTLNYLPNDILTKVDRASMASSLETRAPFLDHDVLIASWRMNINLKINSNFIKNNSKLILRNILSKYLPQELINRPKAGFGIPLSDWLRGPLRSWAGDLLSQDNIEKSGYLQFEKISKLWEDHLSSKYDNSSKLWPIIMWQSWLDFNK